MHIDSSMIHPELRQAGALMRFVLPAFTERHFRLAKPAIQLLKGRCRSSSLKYEQVSILRGDGSRLRLCVYSPRAQRRGVPGLVWMHGGGYAMGTPEQDEGIIERFVKASGCVVAAPDYRLSLDAPYPAALQDCHDALLWLKAHGAAYGMHSDQLMVGGNSAGGGLAAALCLYARDKKEAAIAFQMPLYPMLDDRMATPSATDNDAPVWNTRSNALSWRLYLGELFGQESVPAYAAPARCRDLSGLPPACSFAGSLEPFRDETVGYMEGLRSAGIPVNYKVFEGCFHGFDAVCPGARVSQEATDFLMSNFSHAAAHYFAAQPACRR